MLEGPPVETGEVGRGAMRKRRHGGILSPVQEGGRGARMQDQVCGLMG